MIEFRNITIDSRAEIQAFTLPGEGQNCDLSFANLCSWAFLYQTQYAVWNGFLLLRFQVEGQLAYLMPIGEGDWTQVMDELRKDAVRQQAVFQLKGVSPDAVERLKALFPEQFVYMADRDFCDYIYLREELATLTGKKFQPKRNHLNKFRSSYPNYQFEPLTPDLIPECLKLEEEWCKANGCDERQALQDERISMRFALEHMDALGITGGLLRVDGQIIAFTYGTPINRHTWDICVEKANTAFNGAYAMINYEYVNRIEERFVYINREEDLGLEGLRKAKLSYQPHLLLDKYTVKPI